MFQKEKIGIFVVLLMLVFLKVSYANNIFYNFNEDLERVGNKKFSQTISDPYKDEIYHLSPDFRLAMGDTLIIHLWGRMEEKYTLVIDKDGKILIPRIGSVFVMGNTLDEAKNKVEIALNEKYVNVNFDLGLGNVQNIRISVLGNVKKTGMFSVNPFSKILDGLLIAGGPDENGSLLNVQLVRNGKVMVTFNYYEYAFKGENSKNVTLRHGDKIFVPPTENLVAIRGDVVRSGIYEINKGSSLFDLIEIASGLIPSKFSKKIQIMRLDKSTGNIVVEKEIVFTNFKKITNTENDIKLEYNDTIIVTTEFDYTPFARNLMKTVLVDGEVMAPGNYIIKDGEKLSTLIKRFGGVTNWAYPEGALLTRKGLIEKQKEIINKVIRERKMDIYEEEVKLAGTLMLKDERALRQAAIDRKTKALKLFAAQKPKGRIIIDFSKISSGKDDIVLEAGDTLYIPPVPDWVMVSGAVYNPESVIFKEGGTLNYYLDIVGGLTKKARTSGIHVIKSGGNVLSNLKGNEIISRGDIIFVPEKEEVLKTKE